MVSLHIEGRGRGKRPNKEPWPRRRVSDFETRLWEALGIVNIKNLIVFVLSSLIVCFKYCLVHPCNNEYIVEGKKGSICRQKELQTFS